MQEEKNSVKSVDKSISILETLMANGGPMSIKELCAETKLPKSTLYGLLSTMRERGIIMQDYERKYYLGNRLFEFGLAVFSSWKALQLTTSTLERIVEQTKINCILATVDREVLINVNYFAAMGSNVDVREYIGARIPFHATAQGKVFLASYDEKKVRNIINRHGLKRYTERTIVDPEVLLTELEKVRANGYAETYSEYRTDNRVISVPVLNESGKTIYALGLAGNMNNIIDSQIPDLVEFLKIEAEKLSKIPGIERDDIY